MSVSAPCWISSRYGYQGIASVELMCATRERVKIVSRFEYIIGNTAYHASITLKPSHVGQPAEKSS